MDEWQFLSNDEEEEAPEPGEQIIRFFNSDDYQSLLCKCISALDLKGTPPTDVAQPPDSDIDPQNYIWGTGDIFPPQVTSPRVFPLPIFFERQLKAEWRKPASNKQCPSSVRRLYNLPLVDAPVLDLQSSGILTEDGQGSIRDAWDKKIEVALQHAHEATSMAVKACATASIVSRASIIWGWKMLELLPESETRLVEGATRMLKASEFAADATLDGMIFASRAQASSVVARRGLWLRALQADIHSKQLVAAYAYKGGKLFGPSLEKILVETKEKKKAFPRSLRKPDQRNQPFRSGPAFRPNRFRSQSAQGNRRPSWGSGKPQYRRPFSNTRPNRFPFGRGGKQDREPKNQKA